MNTDPNRKLTMAGRGSVLMVQQCHENNLPDPVWTSDEKAGVTIIFRAKEVTLEISKLIQRPEGEMLRRDLQAAMDLRDDEHFRKAYLLPALNAGVIEMTIPEKPRSNKQRYRLTKKGKVLTSKPNQTES